MHLNKNKKNYRLLYFYVLLSDLYLMEGITYEAESLPVTLKLGKLIVLYDSNITTFDGSIEAVLGRFSSFHH